VISGRIGKEKQSYERLLIGKRKTSITEKMGNEETKAASETLKVTLRPKKSGDEADSIGGNSIAPVLGLMETNRRSLKRDDRKVLISPEGESEGRKNKGNEAKKD